MPGDGFSTGEQRSKSLVFWCPRAGKEEYTSIRRGRKPLYRSIWVYSWLHGTCHIEGGSSPLSPPTQYDISFRNILTGTLRNNSLLVFQVFLSLFFFFCGTGVWTQGFALANRHSIAWAIPSVYFVLVILETESVNYLPGGWPWTTILLISASQVVRITGISHQCLTSWYFWTQSSWHMKLITKLISGERRKVREESI
jgi:hypothetical protein